jgi:hypothetical protein
MVAVTITSSLSSEYPPKFSTNACCGWWKSGTPQASTQPRDSDFGNTASRSQLRFKNRTDSLKRELVAWQPHRMAKNDALLTPNWEADTARENLQPAGRRQRPASLHVTHGCALGGDNFSYRSYAIGFPRQCDFALQTVPFADIPIRHVPPGSDPVDVDGIDVVEMEPELVTVSVEALVLRVVQGRVPLEQGDDPGVIVIRGPSSSG